MLKLRVKQKLLGIWLGSLVLALLLMMGLFEYQIANLHLQSARAALTDAFAVWRTELAVAAGQVDSSAATLSEREDLIAAMNMIDRYQDPGHYQPEVFDAEKRSLAIELRQHAIATGADILALLDTKGHVAAYFIGPESDGAGAGLVSFVDGRENAVDLDRESRPPVPSQPIPGILRDIRTLDNGRHALTHTGGHRLILSTEAPIERTLNNGDKRQVGHIVVGRVLGASFHATVERLTGMSFFMFEPDGHATSATPPLTSSAAAPPQGPAIPVDEAFGGTAPLDMTWSETDTDYAAALRVQEHGARAITFVIAQRKDTLAKALMTFRNTVLVVLAVSSLLVIPIGVFFLNRTITRPVERLAEHADRLRRGERLHLDDFPGHDEFSDLAHAFEDMSDAVLSREAELRDSQASLKNAQRIARLGNWNWDVQSGALTCSEELYRIIGRTPGNVGGHIDGLMDSIHPDDIRALKRRIAETLESGLPLSEECRIVRPDGEERFVSLNGELSTRDGALHMHATLQDITERHLLEQAKSSLISTVSHELRTPLTSITGTLGLAVGGVLGEMPDKLRQMLQTANTNAKRLGALIDDLLDIEKIAGGSMTFDLLPVDVAELLTQARDTNQAYGESHGVTIRIDGEIPDVQVLGDADRLNQVMANLLSNAAKFSLDGGDILIRATRQDGAVAISVRDNGPGIPADFEPHVFKRFAQADQSPTRADQKGGTGLGLSITKAIVEMHDGRIGFTTVRAPAPGHGTTFTFTLPEWREEDGAQTAAS